MRFINIIFDFDGTLTDSRRDIAGAQLWALRRLGVSHYQEEDLYPLIGKPLYDTFASLLPDDQHGRIPEAIALYAEYYPPRALDTTVLFPGVRETLTALRQRGHRLAIASTKKGAGILRATDHFGITTFFDQLQGSDGVPFKPAPDVLHLILRAQGWDRQETIMVGDTEGDLQAGRAAGVATCAVTYGSLTREQLAAHQPDFLVDHFTELPAVVSGETAPFEPGNTMRQDRP
jgi:phosphoglycolate phosphatase